MPDEELKIGPAQKPERRAGSQPLVLRLNSVESKGSSSQARSSTSSQFERVEDHAEDDDENPFDFRPSEDQSPDKQVLLTSQLDASSPVANEASSLLS